MGNVPMTKPFENSTHQFNSYAVVGNGAGDTSLRKIWKTPHVILGTLDEAEANPTPNPDATTSS